MEYSGKSGAAMDTSIPCYDRFKWPKPVPSLSPEQRLISDEFMKYWHNVLPHRFGIIEKFNQPIRCATCLLPIGGVRLNWARVLERTLSSNHWIGKIITASANPWRRKFDTDTRQSRLSPGIANSEFH